MTTYLVKVIIGTEYLLDVDADSIQQVHDRVENYDPNEFQHDHIVQLENETGRAIVQVEEYTLPTCPTCEETKYLCEAHSKHTSQLIDIVQNLIKQSNENISEYLTEMLQEYLVHCVSPCNRYSRA
jgi:transcription termination factor NusB